MPGHRKWRQFKQTDAFTRGMVIGLKRAGWSIRQIAADTHLGASTVHRLWRRWLEQGNVAIYRNAGATRVMSARVDRRILRQAVAAPQATCTAILQHVQDTLDHSISTRTISRRLVANGLHSCRPLRRLPLTPPNRRQRATSTWMTEWHRVVFSDESRFCLSSDSRRVRVWRRRGERSNPAAIVERPTVRQRGIIVWGAIAYDSRSPLLRIQGTMTAQRYVDDVLRPVTLPYLQGVPNALYQQDNARPHTARISQQALQDVQMLPWPPYSPDLSPIEHVWDIIGRRLHALPQCVQKTNCGKWLRGNGEPSLRTPSVCQAIGEAIFLSVPIALGFSMLTDCAKPEDRIFEDCVHSPRVKPLLLSGENSDSVHFLRNIRKYNSCFQMTSFGAENQTHSVTFPTTFSIQGQVYHRIGSLMPSENQPSRFLQIYFVGNDDDDDDIQTDRRCQQIQGVRRNIVQGLQRMLHQHNLLVQQFKTALENLPSDAYRVVENADRTPPGQHPRRYNAPTANEVAVVLAGNQFGSRDIVLHQRDNLLQHVSDTHRFYDALQYPLIFWKGQEGYSFHIPQIDPNTRQPLSKSYIHLRDALSTDANINPNSLGQRIILPSSFVNSPRYLAEYTQDAFCYVRKFGRPDLFITFTSNPSWEELSAALLPGQKQLDRHDITARVFRQKLVKFIGALTKGQLYGATVAWMYSVEWQKRGLPHAHILVWLANKLRPTQIDSVICAEFPDPIQDPLLYNIVVKNMIHGPCGEYNPVSPCMKNSSCSKKYPKQFLLETQTNVLQARILTGSFRGEEVLIPRIPIIPNDLPFKFRRLQFPVMVAFVMTINKSQGQTLQVVGVHLESPCFSHGQFYVACSRVSSPKNLFVFSSTFSKTRNIVYQGALI
ncbi:hypothetical protein LAZ67_4003689 [Cordylochernes scorpioides]|uniref:Uncharacterized protein n=1 Tax=Cordylochernes scorpioides TaxID=51811 RepID=A0ABY6KF04_9ARAC|nr:hypothetical protein LAZ67_4003689 [Cordylochernes scorpioides]